MTSPYQSPPPDPLDVANKIWADVADDPFDPSDKERLRVMVAVAELSKARDLRRLADDTDKPR